MSWQQRQNQQNYQSNQSQQGYGNPQQQAPQGYYGSQQQPVQSQQDYGGYGQQQGGMTNPYGQQQNAYAPSSNYNMGQQPGASVQGLSGLTPQAANLLSALTSSVNQGANPTQQQGYYGANSKIPNPQQQQQQPPTVGNSLPNATSALQTQQLQQLLALQMQQLQQQMNPQQQQYLAATLQGQPQASKPGIVPGGSSTQQPGFPPSQQPQQGMGMMGGSGGQTPNIQQALLQRMQQLQQQPQQQQLLQQQQIIQQQQQQQQLMLQRQQNIQKGSSGGGSAMGVNGGGSGNMNATASHPRSHGGYPGKERDFGGRESRFSDSAPPSRGGGKPFGRGGFGSAPGGGRKGGRPRSRSRSPPSGSGWGKRGSSPPNRKRGSPALSSSSRGNQRSPSPLSSRHHNQHHRNRSPSRSPSRSLSPVPLSKSSSKDGSVHDHHHDNRFKERRYISTVNPYPVYEREQSYLTLKNRYSKLYVTEYFCKVDSMWHDSLKSPLIDWNVFVPFYIDPLPKSDKLIPTNTADPSKRLNSNNNQELSLYDGVQYNARVVISTGFSDVSKPQKSPLTAIKFLVAKKDRSNLMCLGGSWNPELDGGDPTQGDSSLIKTVIRTVKEQTELDLSECSTWIRFMDIHYSHPATVDRNYPYREITRIFLVDAASLIPPHHKFAEEWNTRQKARFLREKRSESKEEAQSTAAISNDISSSDSTNSSTNPPPTATVVSQEDPSATSSTSSSNIASHSNIADQGQPQTTIESDQQQQQLQQVKIPEPPKVSGLHFTSLQYDCVPLSLSGLLDYNESDRDVHTFEVSLFAEQFKEMLQRDFGQIVLQAITDYQQRDVKDHDHQDVDKKRKREETTVVVDPATSTASSSDGIVKSEEDLPESKKLKDGDTSEHPPALEDVSAQPVIIPKVEESHQPAVENKVVNERILRAFEFFDSNFTSYVTTTDLETVIHSLSLDYSHHYVRTLVTNVMDSQFKRVYYQRLAEKELSQ